MKLVGRPILAAVALFAFTLSGCGGAGGGSTVPASQNHAPSARPGSLVLHIRVPRKPRKHRHRGSHYLSPATQSITLALTGPTPVSTTAPLTPTSQGCAGTLASTACTLTIPGLAPGSYSGTVSTWDTTTGTGHELSANQSVSFQIVTAQNNAIAITLGGIPTSAILMPGAGSTLSGNATAYTLSKCGTDTVSVYGEDYEGNLILGAGAPVPSLQSDSASLVVATPSPTSPNAFTITRPTPPPAPASTVHLTATVTPDDESGATPVSTTAIPMTFNHDICGYITQFSTGITSGSEPTGMVLGNDGNLWFTEPNHNAIGQITTAGVVTEFTTGISTNAQPYGITVGPDKNLWFTESGLGKVAKMTTSHTVTEYAATGDPQGIAAGADGRLWFSEGPAAEGIGAITTGGTYTQYTVGLHNSPENSVALGPDGNIWFTEYQGSAVGNITTSGTITEFTAGITGGSHPAAITNGPDGNVWFTETFGAPAKITTDGVVTEYTLNHNNDYGITTGPDGNVWFTECAGGEVAKITTTGVISTYHISPNGSPFSIVTGPDGNLWFTEPIFNRIGQIQ